MALPEGGPSQAAKGKLFQTATALFMSRVMIDPSQLPLPPSKKNIGTSEMVNTPLTLGLVESFMVALEQLLEPRSWRAM